MKLGDYKKVFDYIEEDKYFYIVMIKNSRLEPCELRKSLLDLIMKLPSKYYMFACVSYCSPKAIPLQFVGGTEKPNSIFVRRSILEECAAKLDLTLIEALKLGLAFPKTRDSVSEQRNRLIARMQNGKMKEVKMRRMAKSKIIGERANPNLSKWIGENKRKLVKTSTESEAILTRRLYKTFKKRLKIQQPFVIDGKVYFADICIKSKKTIIEVDGGYHNTPEQKEKDKRRDKAFQSIGYTTIRIKNEDVSDKPKVSHMIRSIANHK